MRRAIAEGLRKVRFMLLYVPRTPRDLHSAEHMLAPKCLGAFLTHRELKIPPSAYVKQN